MVGSTAAIFWAAETCPEEWAAAGRNLVKLHMVLGQPLTMLAGITAGTRRGNMGSMKNPTETQVIMLLYLLFYFLSCSWLPFSKRCDWQEHFSFPTALSRTVKWWKNCKKNDETNTLLSDLPQLSHDSCCFPGSSSSFWQQTLKKHPGN